MCPRRALALLLAGAVAGLAAASALAAGNYSGDAQGIALTAEQAKFKALTGSEATGKPTARLARGFRSGWHVGYLKGTPTKPVSGYTLIYVYDTAASAKRAYANSCAKCSGNARVQGVSMKFQYTDANNTPGVIAIAACRNVYAAIVVSGKIAVAALSRAAGELAGRIYAKAMAGGMSSCASA
jgi:hypothetical protein